MPLVDAPTAKLHLRVDGTAEDALIGLWLQACDQQVAQYLNRHVYPDQGALDTAVAAAPAALAAATAAYKAAIAAAELIEEEVDRLAALRYAEKAYAQAQADSDRAQAGMVVNDSLKAAILLLLGHLYAHREEVNVGNIVASMPMGVHALLQPWRVGMGV